ncbi:TIR domain-containing protein [Oleiharenicola lentus]|uniref:TIR domain-containing protein n=1 Tax=Oleiharenicola lentus TaxID=2508720 RepID=UPI003F66C14C
MSSPKPTIFLSYASEDRASIRQLRDALVEAGLDLWYDESELGGGDAWDQKIRRQIRDCDYFMPVISATTERRKEGYFRREWRIAVERSLDMADDVMFLLPVCLDDTNELHARVPEKFISLQWLRLPGGTPTPALHALLRKLAAGDHAVPPVLEKSAPAKRSSRATPPTLPSGKQPAENHHDGPPPMPAFPHLSEKANIGHSFKFIAEVIWWVITAAWLLIKRAPRWIRILLSIWFVFFVFSTCTRNGSSDKPAKPSAEKSAQTKEESDAKKAAANKAVRDAMEKFSQFTQPKPGTGTEPPSTIGAVGSEIARSIASGLEGLESYGKQIVVAPFAFGNASEAESKKLSDILAALYGQLALKRPEETAISTAPLATSDEQSTVALGKRLGADYVLCAQFLNDNGAPTLDVRLLKTSDASIAWQSTYPLADKDATELGTQIATAVLAATPAKP